MIRYEDICSEANLSAAWETVKAKGAVGGVDGVTVDFFEADLEANLERLLEELTARSYIPEPYKEIAIPKGEHDFRRLCLPVVRDKIVQQAVKNLLDPLLDREFLDTSYAYRVKKGPARAVSRVVHLLFNEKRGWGLPCDIRNFFDSIEHGVLFNTLESRVRDPDILALVRLWVKMGRVDSAMRWRDNTRGVPQGGVISPLLSNLYLHSLDCFMQDRNCGYVRYADDFVILTYSEAEAYHVLGEAGTFLEKKLALTLNRKCTARNKADGFEFLGCCFKGDGITLTGEKLLKLKARIRSALENATDLSGYRETVRGISGYYGRFLSPSLIAEIDAAAILALENFCLEKYRAGFFRSKKEVVSFLAGAPFISRECIARKAGIIRGIAAGLRKKPAGVTREEKPAARVSRKKDPLAQKKREYRKLEAEGLELVVATPGVFIGKSKRGVTVKRQGVKIMERPLLNLQQISVLTAGVSLSSNVIAFCAERRIPIDFLDFRGRPYARLCPMQESFASVGLVQLKALDSGLGIHLAKQFVVGRLQNQVNLMKYYYKYRKGLSGALPDRFRDKIAAMEELVSEARQVHGAGLDVCRGLLFSIEGRASAGYWELVGEVIPERFGFTGRERRGAGDLVNSCLNYGYGVLYSKIWTAVVSARLNPCISYLHKPQGEKPTLVFDLIEEFRHQAVDRPVFALMTKNVEMNMSGGLLALETRKKLAQKVLERINSREIFRGHRKTLNEIMLHQAKALVSCLESNKACYRPYLGKW